VGCRHRQPWFGALFAFCLVPLSSISCAYAKPAGLALIAPDGRSVALTALTAQAVDGVLPLDKKGALRYRLESALSLPAGQALELEYSVEAPIALVLRNPGEEAWALPPDASFLGLSSGSGTMRYRVPLEGNSLQDIVVQLDEDSVKAAGTVVKDRVFRLYALRILPRWYGFEAGGQAIAVSPFVYLEKDPDGVRAVIDPPAVFRTMGTPELVAAGLTTPARIKTGLLEYKSSGTGILESLRFPGGALAEPAYPLSIAAPSLPAAFYLAAESARVFPHDPIPADPGLVLGYRREAWRNPRYEVFRWDRFPDILIFDTADYAVQDRLFKRLAFFVEKAGFTGRLAADAAIAHLHGWNAHDYRAADLAAFFELARQTDFTLNAEEVELRELLVATGLVVLRQDGAGTATYAPGTGALISLSRESETYLRNLFMVHEAFHGLFFTNDDFDDFARQRWENLDPTAKRFLVAYFDSLRYDTGDARLMRNELMAYILQQPVSLAPAYFGRTLPGRLESDIRRRAQLPAKDEASGTWPELANLFTAEARAFSDFAQRKWGLSAGRVWRIF